MKYLVSFEIDVDEENPVEACRRAWMLLSESEIWHPVGVVTDSDGNQTTVDLTDVGLVSDRVVINPEDLL